MKKLGAARVMTSMGKFWGHFSQQGDTIKFRRYTDGVMFDVKVDSEQVELYIPLKECKKLIAAKNYAIKNVDVWTAILHKLETNGDPIPQASVGIARETPITVPITLLRRFYEAMHLLDKKTWVSLAEFYSTHPNSLERLWNNSRVTFESYNNVDDWGCGVRKELPAVPTSATKILTTNQFTAFIKANNCCSSNIGYSFVERELNPRRTTSGVYSNNRPATNSGTGGIDVLLKSDTTGFPAVGEVKVKKDKNAFFALIQAMTYAVELSTPRQLSRLKTHFAEHFKKLNVENGKVEIVLLMVNPVADDTLESVLALIKQLNRRQKCKGLGSVMLVCNEADSWMTKESASPS